VPPTPCRVWSAFVPLPPLLCGVRRDIDTTAAVAGEQIYHDASQLSVASYRNGDTAASHEQPLVTRNVVPRADTYNASPPHANARCVGKYGFSAMPRELCAFFTDQR
jgi:hypothetical protein